MEVGGKAEVAASREQVWSLLWDVERLARCVPGCSGARTLEPGRLYAARIEGQVGPFKVGFPLRIEVAEHSPGQRVVVRMQGNDASVASVVDVTARLELSERHPASGGSSPTAGTELALQATVNLRGRLAALGQGLARRKAEQVVAEFLERVQATLGEG